MSYYWSPLDELMDKGTGSLYGQPSNIPVPVLRDLSRLRIATAHPDVGSVPSVLHSAKASFPWHSFIDFYKVDAPKITKFVADHTPQPAGTVGVHGDITVQKESVGNTGRVKALLLFLCAAILVDAMLTRSK